MVTIILISIYWNKENAVLLMIPAFSGLLIGTAFIALMLQKKL
jgi:hypothetical protein